MTVTAKVQPIDRDLVVRLLGTPQDRSRVLAGYAREKLAEADAINTAVAGRVLPHKTYVDGAAGVSEDIVRPDGVIAYEFELTSDVIGWISNTLEMNSPIGSGNDPHPGLYKSSHVLLADGVLSDPDAPPAAVEYVFINSQPYARKIEQGSSQQFPDGVYETVATMARAKFSNSAKIEFGFRSIAGGEIGAWAQTLTAKAHAGRHGRRSDVNDWLTRQPAIIVTPR